MKIAGENSILGLPGFDPTCAGLHAPVTYSLPSFEVGSDVAGRITLKDVRSLQQGETVWDGEVKGFGARRQNSAAVAYVLMYRTRNGGRQRRLTIGRHGSPWTPDTARDEARRLLGLVTTGADPAADKQASRRAATVADLCDAYLVDAEAGRLLTRQGKSKKASTLLTDRGRLNAHVKPLLGHLPVASVTREDIERFMHGVAEGRTAKRGKGPKPRASLRVTGGRGAATRTMGLLGSVFRYAVAKRMRSDNPVTGIVRFADGRRQRRMTDAEYAHLGAGLSNAGGGVWPPALAMARFLALTGWRRGEAMGCRWAEIDAERRTAALEDTKTGRSVRPLSAAACDVLTALPHFGELVFPASRGGGQMTGFPTIWDGMRKRGAMPAGLTPHVLRHSFASVAADLGYSESTIGALIGHRSGTMTSRYVHHADPVLVAAADAVAGRIAALMEGGT